MIKNLYQNEDINIRECNQWDSDFFKLFISVGPDLYRQHSEYLPISFLEIENLLGLKWANPNAFWNAKIFFKNDVPIARYLLYTKKNFNTTNKQRIHFGYFEAQKNDCLLNTISKSLDEDYIEFQKILSNKSIEVIGLINGVVYNGSRFRENCNSDFFWGELVYQDWYPEYWLSLGFVKADKWFTYKIEKEVLINYLSSLEKLFIKRKNIYLTIKNVIKKKWKNDLFIIYNIMKSSYKFELDENEISFEQFLNIAEPLKLIFRNNFVKLLFERNQPVAFSICYFNIMPIWKLLGNRIINSNYFIKKFWLILFYFLIRFKELPLMAVFTGKSPNSHLQGVMGRLSVNYLNTFKKLNFPYFLVVFNSENSKSHSTLPENKKLYSTHYIMSKQLN